MGMKKLISGCVFWLCLASAALAAPLQTVPELDLQLYSGTWYEIAAFPTLFQSERCVGTSATYTYYPNGDIKVWNQCYLPQANGGWHLDRIEGRARLADSSDPTRLKVNFFGPFEGDYWVIELGSNYQYAVVGHPQRNFLWILSREPELDAGTYAHLLERIAAQGYDVTRLRRTPSMASQQRL